MGCRFMRRCDQKYYGRISDDRSRSTAARVTTHSLPFAAVAAASWRLSGPGAGFPSPGSRIKRESAPMTGVDMRSLMAAIFALGVVLCAYLPASAQLDPSLYPKSAGSAALSNGCPLTGGKTSIFYTVFRAASERYVFVDLANPTGRLFSPIRQ